MSKVEEPHTKSAVGPDATAPPFALTFSQLPVKKKKVLSNSAMEARRKNKFSRPPKKAKKTLTSPAKRKRLTIAKPRKKKKMPKKEDLDTDEYKPLATRAPRMDPSERYKDSKLCEYCSEHSSSGRLHSSQQKTLQLCYACYCYERSNGFLVPKEDRKSSGSRNRKRKRTDSRAAPLSEPPKTKAKNGNSMMIDPKKRELRITFPKFNTKASRQTIYKGVRECLSPRKGENRYIAELVVNGSPSHLGSYVDVKDAARAVNYRCDELGHAHLNPGLGITKPVFHSNKKVKMTKYHGVKQHQNGKYHAMVNWQHIRKFSIGIDFDTAEDAAKALNGFFRYIDLPLPFPELPATTPQKQYVLTKHEGVRRRYGKHGGDYQAFMHHGGQRINLGPTNTAKEACEVINYKCQELGIPLKFPQYGCTKPVMLEMTEYEGVYYAVPGTKKGPFAVRFSKTGESNGVPFSYYLQKNLGEYKTKNEACAAINYKCKLLGMPNRFSHVGWMRPHKGVRRDEGYLKEETMDDNKQIKAGRYDPPRGFRSKQKRKQMQELQESPSEKESLRDIRKWSRPYKSGSRTKRGDFYIGNIDKGGVSWRIFASQSRRCVAKHLNHLSDILGQERKYPHTTAEPAPIFEEWQQRLNEGALSGRKVRKKKMGSGGTDFKVLSKFPTVFVPQGMAFNWMFSYVQYEGKKHLAGMFKSSREAAVGANQLAQAIGAQMPYPEIGVELNRRKAYYGVVRINDLDCYQADFTFEGKKYDLGQYDTAEAAAAAMRYQLAEMRVEIPSNLKNIDPVAPNSVLVTDIYGKPPEGENIRVYNNVEWRKRRQVWVGTLISDGRSYNVSANTQKECAQRLNLKCEELGEKWLNKEAGLPPGVMETLGEEQLERVDATDEVIAQWIQEEMERVGKCTRRVVRAKFNCTPKRLNRIMDKILGAMKEEVAAEKAQQQAMALRKIEEERKEVGQLIDPRAELRKLSVEKPVLVSNPDEELSIYDDQKSNSTSPLQTIKVDIMRTPKKLSLCASPAHVSDDCQIAIETSAEIISPIPANDQIAANLWPLKKGEGEANSSSPPGSQLFCERGSETNSEEA